MTHNGYTVRVCDTEADGWCVQWRTPVMTAPQHWYFETESEAKAAAWDLLEHGAP